MAKLGELNSRMRDFYDTWLLARQFRFEGEALAEAIRRTFATRRTAIPPEPVALTPGFAREPARQALWEAFLRRSALTDAPESLTEVVEYLAGFLGPLLAALARRRPFQRIWMPPGPWR